jgi:hypothetical protein
MTVLPSSETIKAISEAVHRAVVEVTGTDGKYCCLLYAFAGCVLSRKVLQRDYRVQAGSFHFKLKHHERWMCWDARGNALFAGSFHAWYLCSHPHDVEIVDLSSRHYQVIADAYHRNRNQPLSETLVKTNPLWTWTDDLIKKGYVKFFPSQKLIDQTNTLIREKPLYFQAAQRAYEYFQYIRTR